ncbi:MAG: DUF411 domain-containing protein [Hyphomicrobiaceae bacterium]|nr:MAG: DUF411 domain-containing protein [Hyphomicrobiaceae bacterium]
MQNLSLITRRTSFGLIASAAVALAAGARADTRPAITVSKDPNCGCCNGWIAHLRRNGFAVTAIETADMLAVKARLNVPAELSSCHTAEIGGYVVEGHVPAQAILRLLAERPDAVGLAVPGMPIGSPGMEGGRPEVYEVFLFGKGPPVSFGRFLGDRPV